MTTSVIAVQRESLLACGLFSQDRINAEDHDQWMRLGTVGDFVVIKQPILAAYRRHEISEVGNLSQTIRGISHLIDQEQGGRYPGGDARRYERLALLSRHVRPVTFAALREGRIEEGWNLFRRTLGWSVRLGRWQYLAAFPLRLLVALLRRPAELKRHRSLRATSLRIRDSATVDRGLKELSIVLRIGVP